MSTLTEYGADTNLQVSKAAAVHVTRQMAYDLSHKAINVRVNQIAPGSYSAVNR